MKIWKKPISLEELNARGKNTFSDHIGIVFTALGEDYLEARMPVTKNAMQPMGILHGGASCALAETVGSAAGNYCIEQKNMVAVGLDININHIKPVSSGKIIGKATPIHIGKKTQVWSITIHDATATLVAISRLTLANIQLKD